MRLSPLTLLTLPLLLNAPPGLIVIGVAMNEDRAISATDFGYLFCIFIALYIIRCIVILVAYPVLRSVSRFLLLLSHPFLCCRCGHIVSR